MTPPAVNTWIFIEGKLPALVLYLDRERQLARVEVGPERVWLPCILLHSEETQ